MDLKKIPRQLLLILLASGASIIIGFLSFGGMFVLWPSLALAFSAFGLSVAYEGEVYKQNIKGALNKLFKPDHLKRQLAKQYLLTHFPDTAAEDCPAFFKDYKAQLKLLHQFGHDRLDKKSSVHKRQAEKTLGDMEKWFALQLFITKKGKKQPHSPYEKELQDWLRKPQQKQAQWQQLYEKRQKTFRGAKIFSALSGVFMGLGTTYLLVEAFTIIPLFTALSFTAWPMLIVPMAAIAGAAYGLLTYNAITDMITNDTLRKWYYKIKNDLKQGLTVRSVFMALTAGLLVTLATALTICTAGTWWTVAKQARPLFAWMGKMPSFIMGIINPLITGLSSIVFNLQNTSESLEIIDEATRKKGNIFVRMTESIKKAFHTLKANENWLQMLNPFRLLLKLTVTPLRILFFLGHLIGIGVTTDRVPGVSQVFSALLGIISEGFEDLHYFIGHSHKEKHEHTHVHAHGKGDKHACKHGHKHEHHGHVDFKELLKERLSPGHGHSHDLDLPTRALKLVFFPIYALAALWDYVTSKLNDKPLQLPNLTRAWEKQQGIPAAKAVHLPEDTPLPSKEWQAEQAVFRIDRYKEKHLQNHVLIGRDLAEKKVTKLTSLQHKIRDLAAANNHEAIPNLLTTEKAEPLYKKHRFFAHGPTKTTAFLGDLPERIMGGPGRH